MHLRPHIHEIMEKTNDLLEPVIVPVVHHKVIYKEPPPIIKIKYLPKEKEEEDSIPKLAKKALNKIDEKEKTMKSTVGDIAKKALEKEEK